MWRDTGSTARSPGSAGAKWALRAAVRAVPASGAEPERRGHFYFALISTYISVYIFPEPGYALDPDFKGSAWQT